MRSAIAAATIALILGLANFRTMTAPDTQPASQQPWELLRHGTLLLDDTPILREHPKAFWAVHTRGHVASIYPSGMALLAAPIYLPTVLIAQPTTALLSRYEKAAAAILNALTILILGLALARAGTHPRWTFAACILYGLCGCAFSIQSQALWQQTGVSLGVALALFAVTAQSLAAAFAAGVIVAAVRIPDVLMLIPIAFSGFGLRTGGDARRYRSDRTGVVAPGVPARAQSMLFGVAFGAAIFAITNWIAFGSPFATGYTVALGRSGFTLAGVPEAVLGLLISPAHGLLIYEPWALLIPFVWGAGDQLARASIRSAAILFAVVSCWWAWWGGDAFGPRMLAESLVPITFVIGRAGASLALPARRALVALGTVGFLTQAAYVFWLSGDPHYTPGTAWDPAAHPVGFLLQGHSAKGPT